MTVPILPGEHIDDLQRNHLQIIQNPEKFCFGMDAVLLSGFAKAPEGGTVLDLCTGTGIIPILMSAKTEAGHFTALEIQRESADMARRSVLLNGLEDKIDIVEGDVKEAGSMFAAASFDVVTCNPPYMKENHGLTNPGDARAIARHEILCTFEDVAAAAGKLVLAKYHLEPKRMRLVYPYADREPNMVLLDCVRGANPRLSVEKPLVVYRAPGVYTEEITGLYGY